MDPKTRTLVQLTTSDLDTIRELYDTLMGSSSKARKAFIVEHARQYKMVSDDSEDEGDVE